MLGLVPRLWRDPRRATFENHRRKVIEFGAKWKKFDVTGKSKDDTDDSDSSSSSSKDDD